MSLREELASDQNPNSKCNLCNWLKTLGDQERTDWIDVLEDRSAFTHASCFRALVRRNVPGITKSTVEGHRVGLHRYRS